MPTNKEFSFYGVKGLINCCGNFKTFLIPSKYCTFYFRSSEYVNAIVNNLIRFFFLVLASKFCRDSIIAAHKIFYFLDFENKWTIEKYSDLLQSDSDYEMFHKPFLLKLWTVQNHLKSVAATFCLFSNNTQQGQMSPKE